MTVVSNSSPLITLARIGLLTLLAEFYGRIVIPTEVHKEVTITGRGLPGAEEVRRAAWIDVGRVAPDADPTLFQVCAGLGAGERAAILLAKTLSADLILLDESRARRIARSADLSVVGCVGILGAAARAGKISDLRSVYGEL